MKVLLVSPLPPPVGGIATWTGLILSAAKRDQSLEVNLLNTAVKGRSIIAPSRLGRVFVGGGQAIYVFTAFLLRCLFSRPSVVHLCTPCDLGMLRDVPMVAAARVLGIPVVLHFHRGKVPDFPDLMKVPSLLRFLIVLAVRLSNAVIVLNSPALHAIKNKANGRVLVIPNMVDVLPEESKSVSEENSKLIILFVGHVVERKGVYDLVKAGKLLAERGVAFDLRIVGPVADDVRMDLEEISGQSAGKGWLHIVGARDADGVALEMTRANIFCLPSYAEGFPYVILESMAKGLPIVTTNVGAMPEALSDGAGICLEPGDIATLVQSLEVLAGDQGKRWRLGSAARDRCKELYSKEAVFASLKGLWGSVIRS